MISLYVIFFLFVLTSAQEIKYKVCSPRGNDDECQQLARTQDLACRPNFHSVDCLLNIENDRSHLGRIYPEEAFLGANLLSDKVQVLGEIQTANPPPETVVIVRTSIADNVVNLKGKKLCHPGFKHNTISPLLLQELEAQIISLNNNDFCTSDNTTLVEKQIRAISEFLGESCRPGAWTQDGNLDQILKTKYSNLCKLCGSNQCNVEYNDPFNNSLSCLVEQDADIAITTLSDAQKFFSSTNNQQKYKYLCKNGTSSSSSVPCGWTKQLPSLIVAEKNSLNDMKTYIKKYLSGKLTANANSKSVPNEVVQQALVEILNIKRYETINLFDNNKVKSLKTYVSELRTIPTLQASLKCKTSLKWCTYSDMEQAKCQWLSQAAMNRGIQPVVECYRSREDTEISCISNVANNNADIVVVSADYGYTALKKGLSGIAYPETDTRFLYSLLTVIRNGDNSIKSFKDLKSKRACVPQYLGKETLAFIDTAKQQGAAEKSNCDYAQVFNDFVGDSCAPGALISDFDDSANVDRQKLCRQCVPVNQSSTAIYCNADDGNKYFKSNGSLQCLEDSNADFALIRAPYRGDRSKNTDIYRILCKNGTLAKNTGLDVDEDCALNIITSSEIVSKLDNIKNPDIIVALKEFERWFGQDLHKPFHVFDRFNHTLDLLFKDSTPGLDFDDKTKYIKNFKDLLKNAENCDKEPSSAVTNTISIVLIMCLALFKILFN